MLRMPCACTLDILLYLSIALHPRQSNEYSLFIIFALICLPTKIYVILYLKQNLYQEILSKISASFSVFICLLTRQSAGCRYFHKKRPGKNALPHCFFGSVERYITHRQLNYRSSLPVQASMLLPHIGRAVFGEQVMLEVPERL